MRRSAVLVAVLLLAPLASAGTSRLSTGTHTGDNGGKTGKGYSLAEAYSGGMSNHCYQSEELVLKETSVSCTGGGDRTWVCTMSYNDTCAESEGQKTYLSAGYGEGSGSTQDDACAQAKERAQAEDCRELSYRRDRKTDHDVSACQCGENGSGMTPKWMCFAEYRVSCSKEGE